MQPFAKITVQHLCSISSSLAKSSYYKCLLSHYIEKNCSCLSSTFHKSLSLYLSNMILILTFMVFKFMKLKLTDVNFVKWNTDSLNSYYYTNFSNIHRIYQKWNCFLFDLRFLSIIKSSCSILLKIFQLFPLFIFLSIFVY